MLGRPLVSIIVPTYNAVKYVQETLESCLQQTYDNIEIVFQDDCSTDGTWELVTSLYAHVPRVKMFRNAHNLGIGDNWNAAYRNSAGTYVVVFNADDLMHPAMIESFLALFSQDSTIDIVTGTFEVLVTSTGHTFTYPDHVNLPGGLVNNMYSKLFFKSSFHWNYSLVKRGFLRKLEIQEGELFMNTQVCDYELWFRSFLADAKVYFDNTRIWGYYRRHETNASSKPNGELRSFLKDFLEHHHEIIKKRSGFRYTRRLMRNFITFCNNTKSFEKDVFYLYVKRIAQSVL
ncbi:glycosyltransferase [Hymenobacter tibetensis]|uniref:Glycosyltransferase n=1 Tax=Hymenobacter tibetensis TaxID=497967 RepID=A0ABY4D0F2_9BACT|nr:glycosyltransferase family 2 protein [Hymenobacter tibetensis]UOG75796.1 glycosyltransferase [Hymenobacter tibetensis]